MHITSSFARKAPCHLLRESYWQDGKVKKRTLANLSPLPQNLIDLLRLALANRLPLGNDGSGLLPGPARQHGAVSAILGTIRQLRLDRVLFHRPSRSRSLVLAMLVCRLLRPGSKLRVERELGPAGQSTLAALLAVRNASADDLYQAMDWLAPRQHAIERKLAAAHLDGAPLALYDVSSSYLEGSRCELAARGYSRDHRGDRPQIVYGLLCSPEGCPIAVQAFAGNTADPATLADQVRALRERFGLRRVALVGDRGMIAQTRIDEDLKPAGFDWITALRNDTIRRLANEQVIQPGLFDTWGLASVTGEDFPGERLLVCCNPLVAAERRRKREELLRATETEAAQLAARYTAGKYDRDEFNRRLGGLRRRKMGKHFEWTFEEGTGAFSSRRKDESIRAEGRLDGIYVIRTSLEQEALGDRETVAAYKSLARVERAFRSMKSLLAVRPVFHWKERRVRAHLLLCMLAYYVEWHMRQRLAPLLFADEREDLPGGPVSPRQRSEEAKAKDRTRRTQQGDLPLQSFPDLLGSLSSLAAME
ncbi:MAG: IS1634 family transposase, partial [Bryobacterales bacterium]|nr:IS1634 family transposase [Bryobacterales bacterium]